VAAPYENDVEQWGCVDGVKLLDYLSDILCLKKDPFIELV
jgi:hypothetical protein